MTNVQVVNFNQIRIESLYQNNAIVKRVILMMELNSNANNVVLDVSLVQMKKIFVKFVSIQYELIHQHVIAWMDTMKMIFHCNSYVKVNIFFQQSLCFSMQQSTIQVLIDTCVLEPSNCLTCKLGRIEKDCKCIDGFFETGQTLCSQCAFQCATCDFDPINCKICIEKFRNITIKVTDFKSLNAFVNLDILMIYQIQIAKNAKIPVQNAILMDAYLVSPIDYQINKGIAFLHQTQFLIMIPLGVQLAKLQLLRDIYLTTLARLLFILIFLQIQRASIHIVDIFELTINRSQQVFVQLIFLLTLLQLFEIETVLKFGQNAFCYINKDNNQELLIQLGEYSKIEVGDEILFKKNNYKINHNSISHINCETTLEKFILAILQMPINPFPPQIEYHVPLHKLNPFADNSVYLKSIKNNGNRKLDNIIWSCQVKAGKDNSAFSQFLDQMNFVQDYNLLIPKLIVKLKYQKYYPNFKLQLHNTLPSNAVLKFKIQYENFIHINSYSEFTIYTHAGDLPQININVKSSYFVYETMIIGISAGDLNQQISTDDTKYEIKLFEIDRFPRKSSSSQLNISVQSYSFEQINPNISQYTLIIATNLFTQKTQNQNFTIDIPFAGLICQFNNKGLQNIRQDLNLYIECRDLDTKYEWNDDLDLYIKVDCRDITLNRTCQNEQKQIIKVNQTDTVQFIKKNTISSFSVQEWTVYATKFQQTSKFALIIVYLDNDFPALDLEFNKGYLMRKINNYEQLNFTFLIPFDQKANLLDLTIAITYNYEIIQLQNKQIQINNTTAKIYLPLIKDIQQYQRIKFWGCCQSQVCSLIYNQYSRQYIINNQVKILYIMPSINNIKLSINQPPQCSNLFITRSSDLALTNIKVSTTCQPSNDSPYKYQLRLFLRESDLTGFLQGQLDNSLIYNSFQNQNYFSLQIPTSVDQSTVGLLIQVLDGGGSISNVFEKITLKPAKINCSQTQYWNFTLQYQISLLFEAMSQNCEELHNRIYHDLLYQAILPDSNDNNLKFQAIKLYNKILKESKSSKIKKRLLNEDIPQICYDLNTTYFYVIVMKTSINVYITYP